MTERTETIKARRTRQLALDAAALTSLILGLTAYSLAAFSIFSIPQLTHVGLDQVAIAFFTSIALGWDIYNADLPKAASTTPGPFRLILRSLNFLAIPQRANAVLFSLRVTPALIIITLISGITPSIALPYFRQFKITGINSGPFHSSLLTAVVGSLAGLSIILSLLGIFYKVLWAGGAPTSYHYAIIVLIGLSLHYAAGTYIGRERAESIILRRLANGEYDRKGIVVIDQALNPNAEEIALRSLIDL